MLGLLISYSWTLAKESLCLVTHTLRAQGNTCGHITASHNVVGLAGRRVFGGCVWGGGGVGVCGGWVGRCGC